ncbi:MAG: cell division protein FtsZ [Candidatus Latescibacterota bacterium]|nr:MAG: cell division protein FtsZ [Candidatus Latescibacterota bacterium]RKY73969.1 MAG: cell division protein FtsZ [Candidatus Latescibacterota bacterium]
MNLSLDLAEKKYVSMKVIGVGGAGGNAINRMASSQMGGIELVAINTDAQALSFSQASHKVQIGNNITKGLGTGGDPELGKKAAEEDKDQIAEVLRDTNMVFLTAGMGGGTGTGASPLIAELAKDAGALTVGVVTKPFLFEGSKRMVCAEEGIYQLRERVDTLIVIPNQRLLSIADEKQTLLEAFKMADSVLYQATRGISDLITVPGLINLDFNDVKAVMLEMGDALMGTGTARGENRAVEAAQQAIRSPLLEDISIGGAKGVLVNISGGTNMTLHDVDTAATIIYEEAGKDANIILGAVIDEKLDEEIRVTVIATGLNRPTAGMQKESGFKISSQGKTWSVEVPTFIRNRRQTRRKPGPVEDILTEPIDKLWSHSDLLEEKKEQQISNHP